MAPRAPRTTIAPPPPVPLEHGQDGRPVNPPPVVPDVITRLAPDTNTDTNSGHTTIIDVVPDFRFPLMSWLYSVSHGIQSSVFASSPIASPASLIAYTMMMYIGLLFHNDAKLRFVPSPFATAILNDHLPLHVFDLMLDLLVPSFASYEFEALRSHFDDLSENLCYFGSLAGSQFFHDFGRHFPVSIFITLHNLMSQLPGNTTYETLAGYFYSATVATVTIGNNDVNMTPGHYFGSTFRTATPAAQRYRNWLNSTIDNFISTQAIRVVNANATVTRLPVTTPAAVTPANFNPYLYLLGYLPDNANSILELLRNMNDFVRSSFPQSRPLRAFTQLGTQEICRHLIFDSVLPTWHTNAAPSRTEINDAGLFGPAFVPRSPADFSAAINFLVARPAPATTGTPPAIPVSRGRRNSSDTTSHLVSLVATSATDPAPFEEPLVRMFDAARHVLARAIIFDPSSSATAHLAAVITSGKIIEAHDISAIGITVASAALPLGTMNSEFVLGSIPYSQIRDGTTQAPVTIRRRNFARRLRIPQIIIRSLPQSLIVPIFRPELVRPASTHTDTLSALLPGTDRPAQIADARDGINVFAQPLGSPAPSIPNEYHHLWTSYRYYDNESRTWYALPTLRHIYGTRARHFATDHPSLRLH